MSQYMVVFYNNTNNPVKFVNTETNWKTNLNAGEMFRTDTRFNIPDNSDSSKWFDTHHMEVQDGSDKPLFSFWDDDGDDYKLKYCRQRNWQRSTADMPGFFDGGNEATVGMIVSGSPENYSIKAVRVKNDV
jgi:hypothetical protein